MAEASVDFNAVSAADQAELNRQSLMWAAYERNRVASQQAFQNKLAARQMDLNAQQQAFSQKMSIDEANMNRSKMDEGFAQDRFSRDQSIKEQNDVTNVANALGIPASTADGARLWFDAKTKQLEQHEAQIAAADTAGFRSELSSVFQEPDVMKRATMLQSLMTKYATVSPQSPVMQSALTALNMSRAGASSLQTQKMFQTTSLDDIDQWAASPEGSYALSYDPSLQKNYADHRTQLLNSMKTALQYQFAGAKDARSMLTNLGQGAKGYRNGRKAYATVADSSPDATPGDTKVVYYDYTNPSQEITPEEYDKQYSAIYNFSLSHSGRLPSSDELQQAMDEADASAAATPTGTAPVSTDVTTGAKTGANVSGFFASLQKK